MINQIVSFQLLELLYNNHMISIRSLRVDYEDITAVDDLNLEIPVGYICGLVGPNGAGKTSTIKALAGIIQPTYGEIKINGTDFELFREQALQSLGYMPDFSPVYENLKVWEFLDVFAAAYLIDRGKRLDRVEYWMRRVNLTDKRNSYVRDLSRGMRQRLVLAKTLLHDPKVLLLDEPASGLDPIARKEMRILLKEVAQEGKTILISSHILTELSDFCTAIAIMEKGRLVVSGSIEEIRTRIGIKGHLVIRLSESVEKNMPWLRSCLEQVEHVNSVEQINADEFKCVFTGQAQEAAFLLKELVQKGLPILNFYLKEDNVEDIFFKIGAKDVS